MNIEILRDAVVDALLGHTGRRKSDLIVVGHQLAHANRRSLARRLAMKAACSVWMVHEGSPAASKRILVPTDFSEHAADAMRVAVGLARCVGQAEVLALHVYFNEAIVTFDEYDQVLRGQERQAFQAFMEPIETAGVNVTPLFEESANVAHAILRQARAQQADLIVMPTRGRSRAAAILLGSVTEETIIETPIPILVVKHYGAQIGFLEALLNRLRHGEAPRY